MHCGAFDLIRGGPCPLELPHRARFRKYGAYVIQGLREMTGGLCIMVKNDVLFRVVGL